MRTKRRFWEIQDIRSSPLSIKVVRGLIFQSRQKFESQKRFCSNGQKFGSKLSFGVKLISKTFNPSDSQELFSLFPPFFQSRFRCCFRSIRNCHHVQFHILTLGYTFSQRSFTRLDFCHFTIIDCPS